MLANWLGKNIDSSSSNGQFFQMVSITKDYFYGSNETAG
jgi:hypothetical protein